MGVINIQDRNKIIRQIKYQSNLDYFIPKNFLNIRADVAV
jgi:hypothetical protein